jgi:cytochrome c oxidase subunit 2
MGLIFYKNMIKTNTSKKSYTSLFLSSSFADAPAKFKVSFQDPATSIMDGFFLFNLHLLFTITAIVLFVSWLLFWIMQNFSESDSDVVSNFTHSNMYEIIWTSIPALILLSLASPSFSLLYGLDEISSPELALKIIGHQWYWSYELSDFNTCSKDNQSLKFSSYLLTNDTIKENNLIGFFRVLETNRRVTLPTNMHFKFLITSVDVLHSWTIPSFGVKVDACPGRLNQANLFIKRCGLFFGQCSEICGVNHGFMPIALYAVPTVQYQYLVMTNLTF